MTQRIQRKRTRGWKAPASAISVTRPGLFGNPFEGEREVSVRRFHLWLSPAGPILWPRLAARRERLLTALPALRGKTLMCWCPEGAPCHADVLLELLSKESNGTR